MRFWLRSGTIRDCGAREEEERVSEEKTNTLLRVEHNELDTNIQNSIENVPAILVLTGGG